MTKPNYGDLKLFIVTTLKPHFSEPGIIPVVEAWLNRLELNCFDSRRLLICLAIDTKNGLIDVPLLTMVIEKAATLDTTSSGTPQESFHNAIVGVDQHLCLQCYQKDESGMSYVNVMNWGKFMRVLNQINEADLFDINYQKFVDSRQHVIELVAEINDSKVEISGRNSMVWISPAEEVQYVIDNFPDTLWASKLCDKYGLPLNINPLLNEYIACFYPTGIEVGGRQPASINADWGWGEGLFLSYKRDDHFGRSYCVQSGNSNAGKERIHFKYELAYTDLKKIPIGRADGLVKNIVNLLDDGIDRF